MILVTGANGLIGSCICRHLLEDEIPFKALKRNNSDISLLMDNEVDWVEGDILDSVFLYEILAGIDVVIHCAAVVSYNKEDEDLMYKVNVHGTQLLVDACLEKGIGHLIHVSSIAALGKKIDEINITEGNHWIESPFNSVYARTKHLGELEVWRGYNEGLDVCVINPSVVIAAGDGKRSSSKLLKYVWDENKFYIESKLNYVDARDIASVVRSIYKNKIVGERFILNAGNISYQEIFEKIGSRFNKKPPTFKVGATLLKCIFLLDQLKYVITRIKPVVTREMLKSTKTNFLYSNDKSKSFFQIEYKSLDDTLDWACEQFKEQVKI